jgi:hypothetical protein
MSYIAGKYQASPTAYPDGSDVQVATDQYGNVQTKMVDGGTGNAVSLTGSYLNMAAGATTTAKSGAGVLFAVIVNNPGTTITLTLYDNTAGSGTKIATIALAAGQNLQYGCNFGTGLTAVLSGTADVTIVYA